MTLAKVKHYKTYTPDFLQALLSVLMEKFACLVFLLVIWLTLFHVASRKEEAIVINSIYQ